MPRYISSFIGIQWQYASLDARRQSAARRHAARFSYGWRDHTPQTFGEALARASVEVGHPLVGAVVDEDEQQLLVTADGDRLSIDLIDDLPEDGWARWQSLLTAVDEGPEIEVGLDDVAACGLERIWVTSYWPDDMLQEIRSVAIERDRSLSHVVQTAWQLTEAQRHHLAAEAAGRTIEPPPALPEDADHRFLGPKVKQSLYLPPGLYAELSRCAGALDRSNSWLMQRTWRWARRTILDGAG